MISVGTIKIDKALYDFTQDKLLKDIGIDVDSFWKGFESIVTTFGPRNRELLEKRKTLESQIDSWHDSNPKASVPGPEYISFLKDIGYLLADRGEQEKQPASSIAVTNIDPEISQIAGPQLVVPLSNLRYALNAANARWGNLFDALYGTDVISEEDGAEKKGDQINFTRSKKVFEYVDNLFDQIFPLENGVKHAQVIGYSLTVSGTGNQGLEFHTNAQDSSAVTRLKDAGQFVGYNNDAASSLLSTILLANNQLHVELNINGTGAVGAAHHAKINSVMIESAISTIMDCEDSVAAVDVHDKLDIYANWLAIMDGTASTEFTRGSKKVVRTLNRDRVYNVPARANGLSTLTLKGRALCLIRNVGIMMHTDAVLDAHGKEIPEHFLDAIITTAAAMRDISRKSAYTNSQHGSIYIVKPKMHGPEEVAFVSELFGAVETMLALPKNTLKMGIMDEERRTTVNLAQCIQNARERIIFINTGFLDRTGDEIHTSMHLGPVFPKALLKSQVWNQAYEDWNVETGLKCGLFNKSQIGKGMWAAPDSMRDMVQTKIGHPNAGANCAWVPSPTAATLHALHYHKVNVSHVQQRLLTSPKGANLDSILTPPVLTRTLDPAEIDSEIRTNAQSILGYVVRWIDQGVGCSKVPDINDTGLMEDRATLRISSQLLANWLFNRLITHDQVVRIFKEMAIVVDRQNKDDPDYNPLAPAYTGHAWLAALDLVFEGTQETNGYTERVLNKYRRLAKSQNP